MSHNQAELVRNPLEDSEGMSPELQGELTELQEKQADAVFDAVEMERARRIGRERYGHIDLLPIGGLLDQRKIKRAGKAITKHYKKNQGAYQEQAVKDAAAEGVHTNFGT